MHQAQHPQQTAHQLAGYQYPHEGEARPGPRQACVQMGLHDQQCCRLMSSAFVEHLMSQICWSAAWEHQHLLRLQLRRAVSQWLLCLPRKVCLCLASLLAAASAAVQACHVATCLGPVQTVQV